MTSPRSRSCAGFTLMEVLIAAVMLAVGCIAILSCMMQCQKMMLASKRFEKLRTETGNSLLTEFLSYNFRKP